jgi:hypothetical protein
MENQDSLMKGLAKGFILTIVHVSLLIGVPVYMLQSRYDIYQQVTQNPVVNQLTVWGMIIALLGVVILKYVVGAFFYNMDINILKKLWFGVANAIPLILVLLFANWLTDNIEFLRDILLYTAITNSIAYLFAPQFILNMKDGRRQ